MNSLFHIFVRNLVETLASISTLTELNNWVGKAGGLDTGNRGSPERMEWAVLIDPCIIDAVDSEEVTKARVFPKDTSVNGPGSVFPWEERRGASCLITSAVTLVTRSAKRVGGRMDSSAPVLTGGPGGVFPGAEPLRKSVAVDVAVARGA